MAVLLRQVFPLLLVLGGLTYYALLSQTSGSGSGSGSISIIDLLHASSSSSSAAALLYGHDAVADPDADCPFRHSPLYRSVYVYPSYNGTYGSSDDGFGGAWSGPILSPHGLNFINSTVQPWPWLTIDASSRRTGAVHYDVKSWTGQFALELIVRDIMTHPQSCLRTFDPGNATLFYVPYMPSTEYHAGKNFPRNHATSPFAQAILDAIDGSYEPWERIWGLTSKYWKRRRGADHILVHSEVNGGLLHRPRERSHHHYIHCQKQLSAPISISIELSTTFVTTYPKCAAKNILVPYPQPDGQWYNGNFDDEAAKLRLGLGTVEGSAPALEAERAIAREDGTDDRIRTAMTVMASTNNSNSITNASDAAIVAISIMDDARPHATFYHAGLHGLCVPLRQAISLDLKCTAPSTPSTETALPALSDYIWETYAVPTRTATFCPCPVGDTPSARRMYDALIAGCIPIVLSTDFVWPFTMEADPSMKTVSLDRVSRNLSPDDFSIRLNVSDYLWPSYDEQCNKKAAVEGSGVGRGSIRSFIDSISPDEIRRLRRGVKRASVLYSYYGKTEGGSSSPNGGLPSGMDNPLQERAFPDGGAALALVEELAKRAGGVRWEACREELEASPPDISSDLIDGCK